MLRRETRLAMAVAAIAILLTSLSSACGSTPDSPPDVGAGAIVATVTKEPAAPIGGKPAAPPGPAPTTQPAVQTSTGSRPTAGRWIDVDLTRLTVQLMDGSSVLRTIGPVAIGEQINTGAYLSTQTGLFHVYNKTEPLAYDAPYDTYISHWVGFDPAKDNGFHSFLKDETGRVVDASTGKISHGCIRTSEAEAIFAFAEVGMPVYVHL